VERWDLLAIDAPDGTRDPAVLTSDDEGRAVLIRIDGGQELGDHQVKEHAWIVVLDGSVRVRAGSEHIEARAGTLFRFQPDERRTVASDTGARILLLLCPWPGTGHYRAEEKAASER
jgi:quercetin dioxygenase-like cupin family protein